MSDFFASLMNSISSVNAVLLLVPLAIDYLFISPFQYTSYSQQLASQIETLTHQLNERAQENHLMATREKDLIQHVQQLEAQMQKLIQVRMNFCSQLGSI